MFDKAYFEGAMQRLVNRSEEEKIQIIIESYMKIYPLLKRIDPEHEGMMLVYYILGTAIAADGVVTSEERAIVSAIHEKIHGVRISDNEIMSMAENSSDRDSYGLIKALCEQLDSDTKAELITLIAAICSLDDELDPNELQFIFDLL